MKPSFVVRVDSAGKVYAVFKSAAEARNNSWLFQGMKRANFFRDADAFFLPHWKKDSVRDAALHG